MTHPKSDGDQKSADPGNNYLSELERGPLSPLFFVLFIINTGKWKTSNCPICENVCRFLPFFWIAPVSHTKHHFRFWHLLWHHVCRSPLSGLKFRSIIAQFVYYYIKLSTPLFVYYLKHLTQARINANARLRHGGTWRITRYNSQFVPVSRARVLDTRDVPKTQKKSRISKIEHRLIRKCIRVFWDDDWLHAYTHTQKVRKHKNINNTFCITLNCPYNILNWQTYTTLWLSNQTAVLFKYPSFLKFYI